jgi:hypothetical protein
MLSPRFTTTLERRNHFSIGKFRLWPGPPLFACAIIASAVEAKAADSVLQIGATHNEFSQQFTKRL